MIRFLRRIHWAALSIPALALGLGLAGHSWAAPPELAIKACAACHEADGNSTIGQYPKLSGQKFDYLTLQLQAFRSGERASAIMKPFAQSLTDAEIDALSRYYSAEHEVPETSPIAPDAPRGRVIFRASCASCHTSGGSRRGMMGGGMMMRTSPAITPNLFAQHAAYVVQQLDAYASGARPGRVMGPIAARLSREDRQAVADYLASVK